MSISLFNNQERFFFSFGDHILINDKISYESEG